MTKITNMLLAAFALTGCAHTTKGFREKPPTVEATSQKRPDAVLGCVSAAWDKRGLETSYKPLPNGGSVSLDVATVLITTGNKFAIVDAETLDGRTRVRIYGPNIIGAKLKRQLLQDAKDCI